MSAADLGFSSESWATRARCRSASTRTAGKWPPSARRRRAVSPAVPSGSRSPLVRWTSASPATSSSPSGAGGGWRAGGGPVSAQPRRDAEKRVQVQPASSFCRRSARVDAFGARRGRRGCRATLPARLDPALAPCARAAGVPDLESAAGAAARGLGGGGALTGVAGATPARRGGNSLRRIRSGIRGGRRCFLRLRAVGRLGRGSWHLGGRCFNGGLRGLGRFGRRLCGGGLGRWCGRVGGLWGGRLGGGGLGLRSIGLGGLGFGGPGLRGLGSAGGGYGRGSGGSHSGGSHGFGLRSIGLGGFGGDGLGLGGFGLGGFGLGGFSFGGGGGISRGRLGYGGIGLGSLGWDRGGLYGGLVGLVV